MTPHANIPLSFLHHPLPFLRPDTGQCPGMDTIQALWKNLPDTVLALRQDFVEARGWRGLAITQILMQPTAPNARPAFHSLGRTPHLDPEQMMAAVHLAGTCPLVLPDTLHRCVHQADATLSTGTLHRERIVLVRPYAVVVCEGDPFAQERHINEAHVTQTPAIGPVVFTPHGATHHQHIQGVAQAAPITKALVKMLDRETRTLHPVHTFRDPKDTT